MTDTAADPDLDDFFAKKDKTKKKSKSKITTDEIEEKLEKKLKKGKTGSKTSKTKASSKEGGILDVKIGDDDSEWKDVEEEETKDYSGLRIQNLPSERELEERQDNGGRLGEEEDDGSKGGVPGPWKPVHAKQAAAAAVTIADEPLAPDTASSETKIMTSSSKPGKYIPPGARQSAKSTPLPTVSVSGGKSKKIAPKIESQEDFPTLGTGISSLNDNTSRDFEKVKGGGRQTHDPLNQMSKLSIENKYNALGGHDNTVG